MKHKYISAWMVVGSMILLSACATKSQPKSLAGTLNLGGTVLQSTFPASVQSVDVILAGKAVVTAKPDANGGFVLKIPRGVGYRVELNYGLKSAVIVFPRAGGKIDHLFDVKAGMTNFDLGQVRYIGAPADHTFAVKQGKADAIGTTASTNNDVACENGVDAKTGAVCVDDDNDALKGACAEAEKEGAAKEGTEEKGERSVESAIDGDTIACENGVDKAGKACANTDDKGDKNPENDKDKLQCASGVDAAGKPCVEDDGEANDTNAQVPGDAAVGSKNLPASIGCDAGEDEGGDNGGNGGNQRENEN